MRTESISPKSNQNNGAAHIPARVDIAVISTRGSIALLPKTPDAKSYCEAMLDGWACANGVYFVPNASADLILQILTRRYCTQIDGDIAS